MRVIKTASSNDLVVWNSSMRLRWITGDSQQECNVGCAWMDQGFIETLEIDLADGRFYSREFPFRPISGGTGRNPSR
jgi:hypothetical protein